MIRATEAISRNGTLRGGGGLQSEPLTYRHQKLGERKKNLLFQKKCTQKLFDKFCLLLKTFIPTQLLHSISSSCF